MNKRILTVIFLLTANAFLSFHAVLPHHHHDAVACFDESKDCPLNPIHHHRNQLCDNNHDDSHDPGLCILEQAVPDSVKKHIKLYSRSHKNNEPSYIHAISLNRPDPFTGNRSFYKIFVLAPEDLFGYTSYISVSIGLRAPPAV